MKIRKIHLYQKSSKKVKNSTVSSSSDNIEVDKTTKHDYADAVRDLIAEHDSGLRVNGNNDEDKYMSRAKQLLGNAVDAERMLVIIISS